MTARVERTAMAERRQPGFNIPLNFYDGAEVNSIPRRIRAAAIGVWSLAGNYAATQLTDGYVGPEVLRTFGCTPAIRAALAITINKKGELSPLWIEAHHGGVQLTNWPKHQRTNEEVTTYRASEAERKRLAREAKKNNSRSGTDAYLSDSHDGTNAYLANSYSEATQLVPINNAEDNHNYKPTTRQNAKTSGRTSVGRPQNVRSTKAETETETKTESFPVVTSGGGVTSADARETPRPHCPDHEENSDGPCRRCQKRREWDETHEARIAIDEVEQKRAAKAERDAAIAACTRCDEHGQIDFGTSARTCKHELEADHA